MSQKDDVVVCVYRCASAFGGIKPSFQVLWYSRFVLAMHVMGNIQMGKLIMSHARYYFAYVA
jgi:hypothetical protein